MRNVIKTMDVVLEIEFVADSNELAGMHQWSDEGDKETTLHLAFKIVLVTACSEGRPAGLVQTFATGQRAVHVQVLAA